MTTKEKTNGKAVEKTNGKTNGQNVKVSQEELKIIPKDTWKAFAKYWDDTEYEELDAKSIKEILGKYMFVPLPKDVHNRKAIDIWFEEMKELREKGKPFGGLTVCFAGQKATLEDVFGNKPLNPATMVKQLYLYINDHNLSSKNSEPKAITEVKNGKNTVKVNSIAEMEKAVDQLKPKKGKK